jgi:hypothetical protein
MVVGAAVVVAGLGVAQPAFAVATPNDTASTPVGQLTAAQAPGACNDLGAVVSVSVASGFANTSYTAAAGGASTPATFTTNATGAGSGDLGNVLTPTGWTGTATITVTAAGQTGTVTAAIACSDPKGE